MAAMPRRLPPYVRLERTRHGQPVCYYRRGRMGPRVRLPLPGTVGFEAAYVAAVASTAPPASRAASGSLAWLVDAYMRSAHWVSLRPSTRRMRQNILKRVVADAGSVPFGLITRRHINEGIDRRPPHAGNNFRKVMSQLFRWAQSVELVDVNPVDGATRHRIRSSGHHTWTVAEVQAFWARWPLGTRQRLAMDLALFTGLRRGDLRALGRQHVRDGVISITTEKTGATVHLPICAALQASIAATPTGDLAFLVTSAGQPFESAASLGNWFRDACVAAKVPGRLHGLRKAGATLAAEQGATAHQLMSMYGWSRLDQAELYTREADRRRGAAVAAGQIGIAIAPHLSPDGAAPDSKPKRKQRLSRR